MVQSLSNKVSFWLLIPCVQSLCAPISSTVRRCLTSKHSSICLLVITTLFWTQLLCFVFPYLTDFLVPTGLSSNDYSLKKKLNCLCVVRAVSASCFGLVSINGPHYGPSWLRYPGSCHSLTRCASKTAWGSADFNFPWPSGNKCLSPGTSAHTNLNIECTYSAAAEATGSSGLSTSCPASCFPTHRIKD